MHAIAVAIFLAMTFAVPQTSSESLDRLTWLAGSWQLDSQGKHIEEQWTTPSGGMMLGVSRTVANGKTVSFEFLRIEQRGDDLFYIPQPQGRPATEFRLISSDRDEWVFENPQHDFPKRIRYKRTARGSLTASIEGDNGKKFDFPYARAK